MPKYVILVNFTEKGLAQIERSTERAQVFRADAERAGVKVETQLWTVGPYDGLLVLDSPDEHTAACLALSLDKAGHVTTCTLRAFDNNEFEAVLGKMS